MIFEYACLNLGMTKIRSIETVDLPRRVDVLELINSWNRVGQGRWQYWLTGNILTDVEITNVRCGNAS